MSWQKYYYETLQNYPDFVTVKQVMEICNITKKTAYRYIHSGNAHFGSAVQQFRLERCEQIAPSVQPFR